MLANLLRLDLSFCRQVSDSCLVEIFRSESICRSLEYLNIRFLNNITDRGVKPVIVRGRSLRRLDISACLGVELTPCLYLLTQRANPVTVLSLQYLPTCF